MAKRYFRLLEDVHIPGRWALGSPLDEGNQELRTWLFERGESAHLEGHTRIPLYAPGKALDFSFVAGARRGGGRSSSSTWSSRARPR